MQAYWGRVGGGRGGGWEKGGKSLGQGEGGTWGRGRSGLGKGMERGSVQGEQNTREMEHTSFNKRVRACFRDLDFLSVTA